MPTIINSSQIAQLSIVNIWNNQERPSLRIGSTNPHNRTTSDSNSQHSMWVAACFKRNSDRVVQLTNQDQLAKASNIREVRVKARTHLELIKIKIISMVYRIVAIGTQITLQMELLIFRTHMDRLQKITERTNNRCTAIQDEAVIRTCKEGCQVQTQSQQSQVLTHIHEFLVPSQNLRIRMDMQTIKSKASIQVRRWETMVKSLRIAWSHRVQRVRRTHTQKSRNEDRINRIKISLTAVIKTRGNYKITLSSNLQA